MSIYTKTGDKGQTSLATGERVSKTDLRLEAYGTADELNSWIGALRALKDEWRMANYEKIDAQLEWVQQRLFNIGAALAGAPGNWVSAEDVNQLECWIDGMVAETPLVRAFVLPAGSEPVCRAQVCRTVARRLERRMLAVEEYSEQALQFVNRLSDYLFVLAEHIAQKKGENSQKWEKDAKCKN